MIVRRLITLMSYETDGKSVKKTESSFSRIKKAATALGVVLSTGAVAMALRKFINLGSDAAETMNVMNESFEAQTDSVVKWASEQALVLGRSEFALREYAATLGAMLTPMTGSSDKSAEMSKNLAALTVDLGSFFNAAEPDVLRALSSGIAGQTEPLRRFGVVMTQAALDAFAMDQGLSKTVKQMSEAEKVTLRYQFILAKTTKAQGDAARTAGGFANLSKTLMAGLRDLGTEIGMVLVPGAESLLSVLVAIVREVKGPVVSGIRRASTVLGALANKTTLVITVLTAAAVAFKVFGTAAVVAWLKVTAPALAFVALLALIGLAIFAIIEDLEAMGDGSRSVIGGMIGEFQLLRDEAGSTIGAIGEMLLTAFTFWGQKFSQLFGDEVTAEFDKIADAIGKFLDRISAFFRDDFSLAELLWGEGANLEGFVANLKRDLVDLTRFGDRIPSVATASPSSAAAAAAGASTSSQNIEVNVQSTPGMDEQQLAGLSGAATGRAVDAANRRTAQRLAVGGGS